MDRSAGSRERGPGLREDSYGRLTNDDWYTRRPPRSHSRSPGPYPRRRRTRSPPPIDRYVPGRDRAGERPPPRDRDGDFYAPNPNGGVYQPKPGTIDRYVPNGSAGIPPMQSQLIDPHKLDHQVTFSHFTEWINQHHQSQPQGDGTSPAPLTKEDVKLKYDAYREEFNTRMAKVFVQAHMNEEWFREKYMPGDKEVVRQKIVVFRKGRYQTWLEILEDGKLDDINREGLVIPQSNGKLEESKDAEGDDGGVLTGPGGQILDETIFKPTLLIKTISPTVSRTQLEELASTVPHFEFISLSDPNPLKKFHRIAFIILANDAPPVDEDTVNLLNEKKIHSDTHGDFTCHVGIHTANKELKKKVLNEGMSTPENLRKEVAYMERIVKRFEEEMRNGGKPAKMEGTDDEQMLDESYEFGYIYNGWDRIRERVEVWGGRLREGRKEEEEEGEDSEEEKEDLEMIKKTIDLGNEYLRRVYNFCIYCVAEADSIHELTRKCPGGHTRRPTPSDEYTPDVRTQNWIRVWYEKLDCFLEPENQDMKKFGGKPVSEAIEEELNKHVKMEDEGKYRCKVQTCTKLFKAEVFWRKHIEKRHKEWLDKIELEASLVNSYVLDPCRVHPPKVDYNNNPQQGSGQFDRRTFPVISGFPPAPGLPSTAGIAQFPMYSGNMPLITGFTGGPPDPRRDLLATVPGAVGGVGPIRHHRRDPRGVPIPGAVALPANGNLLPPAITGNSGYRTSPYGDRDRGRRQRSPGGASRGRDLDRRDVGRDRERRIQRPSVTGPGMGAGTDAAGPGSEAAIQGRSLKSYNDLDATSARDRVEELDY